MNDPLFLPGVPRRSHAPRQTTTGQHRAPLPALPDEDEPSMALSRLPRSAIRYWDTEGNPVFQQGNQRIVVRHGKPKRRFSGLLLVGIGMLAMLALFIGGNWIGSAWQAHQLDSQYGFPRFSQMDQVTGINHDSAAHPSHFVFENLQGHIIFIDIPAGDISKAKIYNVTTLYGPDAASQPVTASFADVNHDGRLDLLIHLGSQTMVFLNTGSGFTPAS